MLYFFTSVTEEEWKFYIFAVSKNQKKKNHCLNLCLVHIYSKYISDTDEIKDFIWVNSYIITYKWQQTCLRLSKGYKPVSVKLISEIRMSSFKLRCLKGSIDSCNVFSFTQKISIQLFRNLTPQTKINTPHYHFGMKWRAAKNIMKRQISKGNS